MCSSVSAINNIGPMGVGNESALFTFVFAVLGMVVLDYFFMDGWMDGWLGGWVDGWLTDKMQKPWVLMCWKNRSREWGEKRGDQRGSLGSDPVRPSK